MALDLVLVTHVSVSEKPSSEVTMNFPVVSGFYQEKGVVIVVGMVGVKVDLLNEGKRETERERESCKARKCVAVVELVVTPNWCL